MLKEINRYSIECSKHSALSFSWICSSQIVYKQLRGGPASLLLGVLLGQRRAKRILEEHMMFLFGIRDAGSNVHVIEGIDALVILTSVCLR